MEPLLQKYPRASELNKRAQSLRLALNAIRSAEQGDYVSAVTALRRTESRGGQCRSDYPDTVKAWQKRTFITLKEINSFNTQKQIECVA
jgi:aspartate oxidase